MSWLKQHPLYASQAERDAATQKAESDSSDDRSIYSNEGASNGGHGTDDTLAITRTLEEHGIPCCLVGNSALVFYGADRLRDVGSSRALPPSISASRG